MQLSCHVHPTDMWLRIHILHQQNPPILLCVQFYRNRISVILEVTLESFCLTWDKWKVLLGQLRGFLTLKMLWPGSTSVFTFVVETPAHSSSLTLFDSAKSINEIAQRPTPGRKSGTTAAQLNKWSQRCHGICVLSYTDVVVEVYLWVKCAFKNANVTIMLGAISLQLT